MLWQRKVLILQIELLFLNLYMPAVNPWMKIFRKSNEINGVNYSGFETSYYIEWVRQK